MEPSLIVSFIADAISGGAFLVSLRAEKRASEAAAARPSLSLAIRPFGDLTQEPDGTIRVRGKDAQIVLRSGSTTTARRRQGARASSSGSQHTSATWRSSGPTPPVARGTT
jgi:hypothetical protein